MRPKNKTSLFNRLSLFQKYLVVSVAIILASFIGLGISMYFFIANYYAAQQKESLIENANQVSILVQETSSYDDISGNLVIDDPYYFTKTLTTISKSVDADIFIVDNKGECRYYSNHEGNLLDEAKSFPSPVLAKTLREDFFEQGDLNGFYDENYYTAGVPITTNYYGEYKTTAFCYVSSKTTFLNGLIMNFMKIFITASALVFIVAVLLAFFMSYSMVRPLKLMSNAAKQFAVGDFSKRVPTKRKDEIGQLANAFNEMADSLSASEAMRRSFISNVSHELKTPMTTIAGFIDGMLDGTIPKEEHGQYMRIVSNEVKRLSRLVTSMLSLSRIDNGELKLNKQNFDMFSMLLTILATFEQKIVEKKFSIEGLEDFRSMTVYADPDLIYQVIYNLIENAVKFTNEGGYIRFINQVSKTMVTVSIENSGPGIPPEDIKYIFDRFYKTDKSRSIDKKGMGLGLFISKTIMHMHEGNIYVESEPDKYTRFTFTLPAKAEATKIWEKGKDKQKSNGSDNDDLSQEKEK